MNKTQVVARVAEITAIETVICHSVLDALDDLPISVLGARLKGTHLDDSAAVGETAERTGVAQEDCRRILAAFEQTFGEALDHKFRFFRRSR